MIDYSISNQYGIDEEEKRREELLRQQTGVTTGPISPDQMNQQLVMPPQVGASSEGNIGEQAARQNMQMSQSGIQMTPQAQQTLQQNTIPFAQAFSGAQRDQTKLWDIYNNSQYSAEQRQLAGTQLSDMMRNEYEAKKATQFIRQSTPEDLNKMLNARTQEGSWGKAILFGMLGMENSARDEAVKLGVGAKWQTQQVYDPKTGTTSNVLYKVRADGLPMEGYNADTGKQLGSKELASLAGGAQKLDIVGGTYVNDRTGEVGRVITDKTTGRSYIQTDKGRQPMTGFRPQSSMGTMEDMRTRAIQDLNIKLAGKTLEEKMNILRPYNQDLVKQGIRPVDPREIGISTQQIPQNFGQRPQVQPQPQPGQPQVQQQVQQQVTQQATPQVTQQRPPVAQQIPQVSPVQPVSPGVLPTTTTIPTTQPKTGPGLGGRPTGAQLEAEQERLKKQSTQVGEDLGKLQVNQPKMEQNAEYVISRVDDLIKHPGFERSVGMKGPGLLFGLKDQPISGTQEADWMSRFEEIGGRTFLEAFDSLRGGGQITEKEGEKATGALNRMKTSTSEEEFKAAAKDFIDVVKRGINRSREKLGQQPKYDVPKEVQSSLKLTPKEKEAVEWLRNNPDHPRAPEVRKRLGL